MRRESVRRPLAWLLVLLAAAAGCGSPASGSQGEGVRALLGDELTVRRDGSFGLDRVSVERDARFSTVLRVAFPKGSASPEVSRENGRPGGGVQAYARWDAVSGATVHLRYYVRFATDFDFVKGGKLPGLYAGSATSGGDVPDGTDGWSTRYMWRADGAGEIYAYLPTSRDERGTSLGRGTWTFPTGRWVALEQAVTLNQPGAADGSIRVWLDGRLVLTEPGLRFRDTADVGVDGVFFSTFFGGGDPSWATPKDQHIDFAGLSLSTRYVGP